MGKDDTNLETAAAYVRMSTDHQNYSTDNQMDVISQYAESMGIEISEIFSDDAKSGLYIGKREEIKRMFDLINSGEAKFKHILVYDVSRWGRFADPDEAAYYEFQCKRAGIKVHYCAEMFKNDGSFASDISKIVKRKMAYEYLRELSAKVLQGQCNLVKRGFKQSGFAGYGLRRALIDERGNSKGIILKHGERKSIQSDRVILVLGPPEEVANVRWMYSMFIDEGKRESEIADILNSKEILTDLGRSWNISTVRQVLTNEKYIGNYLFNRVSHRLAIQDPLSQKRTHLQNPPEQWIRYENGFEAIIEKERFLKVREIMAERVKHFSDEYLLDQLKAVYVKYGMVSGVLINETEEMPSSGVYAHRFGSLIKAYRLIGYTPERDYSFIEINRFVREMHSTLIDSILESASKKGLDFSGRDEIRINGEVSLSLVVSRCRATSNGRASWVLKFERRKDPDFTIAVRLNTDNATIKDYFVISRYDMEAIDGKLWERNGIILETFRHDNIDWFYSLFSRKKLRKDI